MNNWVEICYTLKTIIETQRKTPVTEIGYNLYRDIYDGICYSIVLRGHIRFKWLYLKFINIFYHNRNKQNNQNHHILY